MSWTPLVAHESILSQFRSALARGRLGHAFLFVGTDGIGKRRTARQIAQGLLCESQPADALDPCGTCAGCRQLEAGAHPDYFEVARPEEKHELPIAVIQQLCERLTLKPARGRHKVAVVDDADLLNEEAANCFLKTLEEPPDGSLLILLATSAESQLTTIVSRCQLIRFRELTEEEVSNLLQQLGHSTEDARRLARWGNGSVGRALALTGEDWPEMRCRLLSGLSEFPAGAVPLTIDVQRFIDNTGKDSTRKRARAREIIRLAMDFYAAVLTHSQRGRLPQDAQERQRVEKLAATVDVPTLLDLLERCLQADRHISRYLHQPSAIECWIDDLAQITARRYVPAVGS